MNEYKIVALVFLGLAIVLVALYAYWDDIWPYKCPNCSERCVKSEVEMGWGVTIAVYTCTKCGYKSDNY